MWTPRFALSRSKANLRDVLPPDVIFNLTELFEIVENVFRFIVCSILVVTVALGFPFSLR